MNRFQAWIVLLQILVIVIHADSVEEDEDLPSDYDYPGFSRGASYHRKKQTGRLRTQGDGHTGEGGPDGHKDGDKGHWEIECGTLDDKDMTIHHYGFGYEMYAVKNSSCKATEGDGHHHFIIRDAMSEPACKQHVHKMPKMEVYTLDVVIQQHPHIRRHTDPVYSITCNYEKGGATHSSVMSQKIRIIESDHQQKGRRMKKVFVNESLALNVSLSVHDEGAEEVREVLMGQWIQLRSFLYSQSDSVNSFKIFHCFAQSVKTQENTYDILVKGCGDGQVIPPKKGFYTAALSGPPGMKRTARSVFFQAFTVPEGYNVIYTCDFIVCWDPDNCDGASCSNSKYAKNRSNTTGAGDSTVQSPFRIKRALKESADEQRVKSVSTPALKIIHPGDKKVANNKIRKGGKTIVTGGSSEKSDPVKPKASGTNQDWSRMKSEEPTPENAENGTSWLHIVLIVGLSLIVCVLLTTICCICVMARRLSRRHHTSWLWGVGTPQEKDIEYIDLAQGSPQPHPNVGVTYAGDWASPYKAPKFSSKMDRF